MNILVIVLIMISKAVFAAHPLITDDTGVQGKGNWQLESYLEIGIDKEDGEEYKTTLYNNVFTFGLTDSSDLVFSIPYIWEKNDLLTGSYKTDGFSDLTFEVKKRFYENNGFSLALKPGIIIPTGDENKGLGSGKLGYTLYLILSKEYKKLNFHINTGYTRNENKVDEQKNIYSFSIAVMYEIFKKVNIVADLGRATNTNKSDSKDPIFGIIGFICSPNENLDLDVGIKLGLNSVEVDLTYMAGLTFRW